MKTTDTLHYNFLSVAYEYGALQFGEFVLNSGRVSPYFLNTGLFSSGETLCSLSEFYAQVITQRVSGEFMIYGHAYKGIPLAASTAMELHRSYGVSVPFAFNRKEAKDHGDTGWTVGAPLRGRVVIVEDVITSGLSIERAVEIISSQGAVPTAVVISLDRMERSADSNQSAVAIASHRYNIDIYPVATVRDLIEFVSATAELRMYVEPLHNYVERYGVN
ncbi:MAG: orotate phosphoribosyltransferase [Acidiferrobacterales bacterium]|nr:orotate phosphoribosyltransferase [Acidiferrobacterales bacterium]